MLIEGLLIWLWFIMLISIILFVLFILFTSWMFCILGILSSSAKIWSFAKAWEKFNSPCDYWLSLEVKSSSTGFYWGISKIFFL